MRAMTAKPPIAPPAIAAFEGPGGCSEGGGDGEGCRGSGVADGIEVLHVGAPHSIRFEVCDC